MNRESHVNHAKLEFSCSAGAANINVYTGRVLFESLDLVVGVNSFAVYISHIYDSNAKDTNRGFGNGWKLNIEQMLERNWSGNEYQYTDSYGYKHTFEQFDLENGYTKYFDRTGLGLMLWEKEGELFILDAQGEIMRFNTFPNGIKLVQKTTGNGRVTEKYDYNDQGRLEKVYVNERKSRVFKFTYNEVNNLLTKISCDASKTYIEFVYDSQRNLESVKKTVGSSIKFNTSYSYQNGLLKYAVSLQDNTSLQFVYDDKGRAESVSDGLMKTQFRFSKPSPALFASNSLIAGTGKYCGQQERKFLGYTVSKSDSDYVVGETTSGINFESSYTTVKNGKGVTTVYFFNGKGFTTGILEQAYKKGYRTLFRQTGVNVSNSGDGDTINGNQAVRCTGKYYFSQENIKAAKDYFGHEVNKKAYDYLMSFWVKLEADESQNVRAKLCLKCKYKRSYYNSDGEIVKSEKLDGELISGSSLLDRTARGGWQYVTIPFCTKNAEHENDSYKDELTDFHEICHIEFEGAMGEVSVADVRISAGQAPVFKITKDESSVDLDKVSSIKYTVNGKCEKKQIAADFFMTESDVMLTALELCKAEFAQKTLYTLTCNAGTQKIANVSEVSFNGEGKSIPLSCSTAKDEVNNNTLIYFPSYVSATEPATGDNRNYNYTAYALKESNDNKRVIVKYVRQRTHAVKYSDKANKYVQVESNEYTWQDEFGRTIKKRDAYGVITDYIYDDYGNLLKTIVSAVDSDEQIISEHISAENIYEDYETLSGVKDGVSNGLENATFTHNAIFNVLESETQKATKKLAANTLEYSYNEFKDRLQRVQLKVGDEIYGRNTLQYDSSGRLCLLSPSENIEYGFKYNAFGKPLEFMLNGVAILTKTYDNDNNSVTATYIRSETEKDTITNKYDKYGRLKKSYHNNNNLVEYRYEDESGKFQGGSPKCAYITSKKDYCTGRTYTYEYDQYTGNPTRYKTEVLFGGDKLSVSVFACAANNTRYDFGGWVYDFEDEIIFDDKHLLLPRVSKFTNNNDTYGMSFTFKYDKLGRYTGRDAVGNHPDSTITYKKGTYLRNTVEYKNLSTIEKAEQEYDERGNVTKIATKKGGTIEYEYDAVNRLIREKNEDCGFTRTYEYDKEGNISSVTENGITETSEYQNGRLMRVKSDGRTVEKYEYDIFGNPILFKGNTLEWTRGTLLKKYGSIEYTYDAEGKLYRKKTDKRKDENLYDGDKLIIKKIGGNEIRFFYDLDGVAGFKIDYDRRYTYIKDLQGNVIGLYGDEGYVARYIYDAWGQCKALYPSGNEITDRDNPALLNPFRWKSQYYDNDTGLYYIDGRWYDPERGRFISSASPEMLLQNASVIFGLNLYTFTVSNPLVVLLACGSIYPSLDFYYNGAYKTWWEKNKNWVLFGIGVLATIVACIAAPFTCGASSALISIGLTLGKIAVATLVGAASCLVVGGTIAGIQSALTGHGFWESFQDSVSENAVDALVTSFAIAAVSVAASNVTKAFQCFKAGTLVETEEGLKPIEEIEVGDKVLAYDEETGEQAYKEVLKLYRNETHCWCTVRVKPENGEESFEIVSTLGHKYYLPENIEKRDSGKQLEHIGYTRLSAKWVSAEDLKIGDRVLLSDGTYATIQSIEVKKLENSETTYNFEVEDFHTYFVGEERVLVHNADCGKTPDKDPDQFNKLKNGQGYRDADGNIWKKDMLHKDHWDVSNRKGKKIKEVDFSGNQIWPGGPKNKNKF